MKERSAPDSQEELRQTFFFWRAWSRNTKLKRLLDKEHFKLREITDQVPGEATQHQYRSS